MTPILDECVWHPDRLLFHDLVFLLAQDRDEDDDSRDRAFGGVYIIEDWAWAYFPEYQRPEHPMFLEPEL